MKKGKLEEKKQAYLGKKEEMMGNYLSQMKEQTQAAQKHAATGGKLEKILDKNHKLAAKKEKKNDLKFMLKMAQKNGDQEMYKKCMSKMTKLCSLSDSEEEDDKSSDDEVNGQQLQYDTPRPGTAGSRV